MSSLHVSARSLLPRGASIGLALALSVGFGHSAAAQDGVSIAGTCGGTSVELTRWCQELVLIASAVQRGVGLGAAGGSDIPGTPSTLGRRLGSVPRIGLSLSGGAMRVALPEVSTASGASVGQETFTQLSARAGVAFGLVDGFQLAPTIGGVLSLDVLASYSAVRLPPGAGFHGSANGFGIGGRLGLLRESFTLPGVSVSATRRWMGTVNVGDLAGGDMGTVRTDVRVTSYRATVGKNLFAVGLLGGFGWDRVSGDVQIDGRFQGGNGPVLSGTGSGEMSADRRLYFVSGWFGFLVYQVSGELGYVEGSKDPFVQRLGSYDPSERSFFASLAFRITL